MNISQHSLDLTRQISDGINNQTFHHHYHILYDIAKSYEDSYLINYLEIGCYAGGSACLMLQRQNTNVISIDIGKPIEKKVVLSNVRKFNLYNNLYHYIEGDSRDIKTQKILDTIIGNKKIDILFIDGDHSYDGVKSDFEIYSKYLNSYAYIVFDDYNDNKYSPEVKLAVDDLDFSDYTILGQFGSEFGARPIGLESNEFVIRRKN